MLRKLPLRFMNFASTILKQLALILLKRPSRDTHSLFEKHLQSTS
jgi:hypothetical protein